MSEQSSSGESRGILVRPAEYVVAVILFGLGALVVFDSVRLGFKWGSDGPEAGYFPFYIGAFICLGCVVTLVQTVRRGLRHEEDKVFVEWGPLRQVLQVLIPACFYVLGIQVVGIYLSSALYIAVFMVWLGNYGWIKSLLLGLAISVATFVMFEIWFKVPLFKGTYNPLSLIGY